jgi:hypothetical protein
MSVAAYDCCFPALVSNMLSSILSVIKISKNYLLKFSAKNVDEIVTWMLQKELEGKSGLLQTSLNLMPSSVSTASTSFWSSRRA